MATRTTVNLIVIIVNLLLLSLIGQSHAQNNNFIVNMVQYLPDTISEGTFRCHGSVISANHVVTTADCARVDQPWLLGIQFRSSSGNSTTNFSAWLIFYHPHYTTTPQTNFDVAVVLVREI